MTLTIAQGDTFFDELATVIASAVWMSADGTQLILYDPDPSVVDGGGARVELANHDVTGSPTDPADVRALIRYAGALSQQLIGAAQVSYEARLAAAGGGPTFSQGSSIGSVHTTSVGTVLASKTYELTDPSAPAGAPALLTGFVPGAAVAAVIDSITGTPLDDALDSIDTLTAAV